VSPGVHFGLAYISEEGCIPTFLDTHLTPAFTPALDLFNLSAERLETSSMNSTSSLERNCSLDILEQ
jgi:hypothetical protein